MPRARAAGTHAACAHWSGCWRSRRPRPRAIDPRPRPPYNVRVPTPPGSRILDRVRDLAPRVLDTLVRVRYDRLEHAAWWAEYHSQIARALPRRRRFARAVHEALARRYRAAMAATSGVSSGPGAGIVGALPGLTTSPCPSQTSDP